MAVTVTPVGSGAHKYIADVIATADADTTATLTHGLGATPEEVSLTPLVQATAALSLWAVTAIGATTVTLTKSTAVGSGGAAAQVRCVVSRPHSITR